MSYLTVRFDHEDRINPAPEFRLLSLNGNWLAASQLYADGSLVLMFLHASEEPVCQDFISSLQSNLAVYQHRNAQVAVVFPQPVTEISSIKSGPALIFLADPDNTARRVYASLMAPELVQETDIMLFVLDNHGGIYICLVGAEPENEAQDELLTWLDYISIQCPE
jgi:peroxiredoxin